MWCITVYGGTEQPATPCYPHHPIHSKLRSMLLPKPPHKSLPYIPAELVAVNPGRHLHPLLRSEPSNLMHQLRAVYLTNLHKVPNTTSRQHCVQQAGLEDSP